MGKEAGRSGLGALLKGLVAAIGVTLPGILLLALLVVYAQMTDGLLTSLNQALKLMAVFAGAWAAVGRGGTRGLALGAAVGLMYIALGYGICALWGGVTPPAWMLSVEFLTGALLGGISGALIANLPTGKKGRSRRSA